MMNTDDLKSISDDDLLRRLLDLSRESRRVESDLVAHIAEVDERRLYAREACSSMFVYCREVLHLAEHEAYLRIAAARAARRYPVVLEFHHHDPFGRGGDHDPDRISLMCRCHNQHLAEREYGKELMGRYRGNGGRVSETAPVYGFMKPLERPLRPLVQAILE